ncbi:phosphate ABC transporter permease PstA, partial [Jatrophihabitans endophyticus]|uniref:phosphate ABC transporter permease PstA n=1 Tax=Jatrophihabitans endophyticus TaxID=1206085 RepID=UPI0019EA8465
MSAVVDQATPTFATASGSRRTKNGIAGVLVTGSFLVALVPLVWLLWTVISNGIGEVVTARWWTESQRNVGLAQNDGGVLHAIIGTAEIILITTVISVPIALLVGIYLIEYGRGAFARVTTFMVDILTGIPSIVAALFIFALFITALGGHRSEFLASLALVILMVPVIVRTTEEMLKLVPNELREASYALGVSKWRTIVKVVIPTAFTGIVTGIVLGIARVAGETAPLLILVGYTSSTNGNPFTTNESSLVLEIKQQFFNI